MESAGEKGMQAVRPGNRPRPEVGQSATQAKGLSRQDRGSYPHRPLTAYRQTPQMGSSFFHERAETKTS